MRLNKALGYHIKEVEDLRKRNAALAEENNIHSLHKVTHHFFFLSFLLLFSKDAYNSLEMTVKYFILLWLFYIITLY